MTATRAISLEALRAAGRAYARKRGVPALRDVLRRFGAKRLPGIEPGRYAELADALRDVSTTDDAAGPSNEADSAGRGASEPSVDGGARGPVYDAAVEYVERGYAVVLLYGVRGDVCTCRDGASCKSPGKHPIGHGWPERAARTPAQLRKAWDARRGRPTNIGILVGEENRELLIDVDVKREKRGLQSLAEWAQQLSLNFDDYLTQATASGGRHYLFRVPQGVDLESLPNRSDVAPGIDVLRSPRQFVVSPSVVAGGRRYLKPGDESPVVLPPVDELPEAPVALVQHLQSLGGDHTRAREPVADVESLKGPSVEKVREAVSHIPNDEDVDRSKYIWMAYRILAACGRENEADAREIFLDWAAKYPGSDPTEDERVFETLNWVRVEGGWDDLWHLAAGHGYDASAEHRKEAEEAFEADDPAEADSGRSESNNEAGKSDASGGADGSREQQPAGGRGGREPPVGVRLFRTILDNPDIEVFHDRRGKRPHVRIRYRERWQTHSLDSDSGVSLLRHVVSKGGRPPSPQAFNDALQLLKSHARFEAPSQDVYVRVARTEDAVYIDLGDDSFRAIEVKATGWSVIDDLPVRFIRGKGMRPLLEPVAGGSVDDFRPFFATESDEDLRLLIHYMVDVLSAPEDGARVVLVFDGPPGSGKSTMTHFAKELTDPHVGGVCAPSKDERELVIAARANRVVAFDNASTISPSMSDAFCRLAAGGGVRVRKLYTDEDETIFDERRHIVLNSIGDVAKQADLRDRALFISAGRLKERRDDTELHAAFEEARPRLLGVILNAVARAMAAERDALPDSELPRMAAFARRGFGSAPALGWTGQDFLQAYRANIEQAALDFVQDDLVAHALLSQSWRGVRAWLRRRMLGQGQPAKRVDAALSKWAADTVWYGAAADLLAYLEEQVGWEVRRKPAWPRGIRWFGRQLKMVADPLKRAGWEIFWPPRTGKERPVAIRRVGEWENGKPDLDDDSPASLADLAPDGPSLEELL